MAYPGRGSSQRSVTSLGILLFQNTSVLFPFCFCTGGCRWIRTPAIIYSTHVATTLFAILAHILFHDFSRSEHAGPQTLRERLVLLSIYLPYLLIPLLLLFTMLCNPHYKHVEKRKRK